MRTLADWLEEQIRMRGMTQQAVVVYAGVSGATISEMVKHGHIPKMEILFRLADYFETPREYVLRLVTQMPVDGSVAIPSKGYLVQELLEEFRKVPDEWKAVAVQQVELVARMTSQPAVRMVGEEEAREEGEDEEAEAEQAA